MKHASTHRSRALNVPIGGRASATRRKYESAHSAAASDPMVATTIWKAVSAGMSGPRRAEAGLSEVGAHVAQTGRCAADDGARERQPARHRGDVARDVRARQRPGGVLAQAELEVAAQGP